MAYLSELISSEISKLYNEAVAFHDGSGIRYAVMNYLLTFHYLTYDTCVHYRYSTYVCFTITPWYTSIATTTAAGTAAAATTFNAMLYCFCALEQVTLAVCT